MTVFIRPSLEEGLGGGERGEEEKEKKKKEEEEEERTSPGAQSLSHQQQG